MTGLTEATGKELFWDFNFDIFRFYDKFRYHFFFAGAAFPVFLPFFFFFGNAF
jgi:hypothetical protein